MPNSMKLTWRLEEYDNCTYKSGFFFFSKGNWKFVQILEALFVANDQFKDI